MLRWIVWLLAATLALPAAGEGQVVLIPSDRAPYRQKFDLQLLDAQYLFLPQGPLPAAEGPYRFRFQDEGLNALLEHPSTVRYVSAKEGGFLLQLFHLRVREVPAGALGPQRFEVTDGAGAVVGEGTMLVLGRPPEPVELTSEEGSRVLEVGRPTAVRLRIRTNGNFYGDVRVLNGRDFEVLALERELEDSTETIALRLQLRPLRPDASELKLGVETLDGRTAELVFGGLSVRPSAPRRIRVAGGPIFLDPLGRGAARLVVSHFSVPPAGTPEIVVEPGGELVVSDQEFDPERQEIRAQVELISRGARAPGAREVREIQIRAGLQTYRGFVEVVGTPVVSGVRTEAHVRPVLAVGAAPNLLRIAGQNLDGLRLDCSPLGPGARCRNLGSSPVEIVEEVVLGGEVRDGEVVLPLVGTEARPLAEGPLYPGGGVRVQVERPSVPLLLSTPGLLSIPCVAPRGCRASRGAESMVVRDDDALQLRLVLDDARIPAEHGWQKVMVTVTRVRGEQRQVVRSLGSPAAPRLYRQGEAAGSLPLLDTGAEPRHGDLFIVRVEHVAEQYPLEHRNAVAAGEPFVRRIYIDGGALRRLTGDIAVQPVLFSFGGKDAQGKSFVPLYPNAGLGVTWQFLNERMEPRPFSAKLQILATNIRNAEPEEGAAQPAVLLSGNLRIPGTDPAKPLVVTTGIARMLGGEGRWRIMAGAGMDLGVAKLIFGS